MTNMLKKILQRALRRCAVKIDENTIELKERKGIFFKLAFIIITIASLYIDFIEPTYRRNTWESLQFTFQPETRFQRSWEFYQDPHNIGFSYSGENKEQFMAEMWEEHKGRVWEGYYYVGKYLLLFFILLRPAKKRVRFDRKRGIVYTYVGKKFYITELNKLMRPFPEYISAVNATLFIWVHPYRNKGTGTPCFRGPQIAVVDRSAWLPMLGITLLPFLKEEFVKFNTVPYLKKVLVDFMNPETPQERIDEILNTINGRKGIFEWVFNLMFNWIDGGLYCKKLPKQAFLEEQIHHYFKEESPNIEGLPSFRHAIDFDSLREQIKGNLIISVEENRQMGYRAPCPNLFEYPRDFSLHASRLLGSRGNIQDETNTPPEELEKLRGKKKRKKRK
ncbi:hypothetical protein PHA51_07840 [Rodentibacter pneumotropicus]|uniref:hypothetical protein n=1 Tax=Rodentibacter pneumotropicus TaxID=758 RepID=UPI00232EE23F|nr:hypothetical protein [Rodentibacter pneumotropicus]MDC2825938.1 hypothetical protein [Rodentibacter pneumotropicus]